MAGGGRQWRDMEEGVVEGRGSGSGGCCRRHGVAGDNSKEE